jgi:hypothetical protein
MTMAALPRPPPDRKIIHPTPEWCLPLSAIVNAMANAFSRAKLVEGEVPCLLVVIELALAFHS